MQRKQKKNRGFTLAEIMVVIVILGLLATLVVPNVMKALFQGNIGVAKSDIQALAGAIRNYALENTGRFPESLEVLVTPDENGATYLTDRTQVPLDPWKNEYFYEIDDSGMGFTVGSFGADGQPGGEGDAADITNKTIANQDRGN